MIKQVSINSGFYEDDNSFSLYDIVLESETLQCTVASAPPRHKQVPIAVLRDRAADLLAKHIVSKLHYEQTSDFTQQFHHFSIRDFSISERKLAKQRIEQLTRWLKKLQMDYDNLAVEHDKLLYNSRPLLIKFADWLLYDKPFRYKLAY